MIEATKAGVVAWRVKPGQMVKKGEILGEIVDIGDPDEPL
jgi:predicted deacylase